MIVQKDLVIPRSFSSNQTSNPFLQSTRSFQTHSEAHPLKPGILGENPGREKAETFAFSRGFSPVER